MISSEIQLLHKIHPSLISILVRLLTPVCVLFICHLAVGMSFACQGGREKSLPASHPHHSHSSHKYLDWDTFTHANLCQPFLPQGYDIPNRELEVEKTGWSQWLILWVFPLFFCILCRCAPGYFGNPQKFGGSCQPCNCNSNGQLGSCDPLNGGKINSHLC